MANSARGEAEITVAGKAYKIAFTLQTLALMGEYLGVKSFKELEEKLTNPEFMLPITKAVLHGNGHMLSDEDISRMEVWEYLQGLIPALNPKVPGSKPNGSDATARPQRRPG